MAQIKLLDVKVIDPNHVGNEWYYIAEVNKEGIKIGEEKYISAYDGKLYFHLEAYEKDKITDKGILDEIYDYAKIQDETITLDVIVKENRGRYTGNEAIVRFIFEIH